MSLAGHFLDDLLSREDFAPVPVALVYFSFCDRLPAQAELAEHVLAFYHQGVIAKLPDGFKEDRATFIIAFNQWRKDGLTYSGPTIPLHELLPVGEIITSI